MTRFFRPLVGTATVILWAFLTGCVVAPKDSVIHRVGFKDGRVSCLIESRRSFGTAFPTIEGVEENTVLLNRQFSVWTAVVTDKRFKRIETDMPADDPRSAQVLFDEKGSIEQIRKLHDQELSVSIPDSWSKVACGVDNGNRICVGFRWDKNSEGTWEIRDDSGEILNRTTIPVGFNLYGWDLENRQILFLQPPWRARKVEIYVWAYGKTNDLKKFEIRKP